MGLCQVRVNFVSSLGKYILFIHLYMSTHFIRFTYTCIILYTPYLLYCNDISIQPYFIFMRHHSLHFWEQLFSIFWGFFNFLNIDWCKINSLKKLFIQNKECNIQRFCVKIINAWRKFNYLKAYFDESIEIGTCIYQFQKNVHVVTLPLKIYNIFV